MVTAEAARRELARREERDRREAAAELARRHVVDWLLYCFPNLTRARHVVALGETLEAVERREITRLIIEMPPQHTKSTTASQAFMSWYLGRNPTHPVLHATYGAELAARNSRIAREMMESYGREVFGHSVKQDSRAAYRWDMDEGGGVFASGMDGGATGRGAKLLIWDDPYKDDAQADSETYRQKVMDRWYSVYQPRLHPEAIVILILTRWHEDDIAAKFIGEGGWERFRLPAIAEESGDVLGREPGEPLWHDLSFYENLRDKTPDRFWSAMYQQRPHPPEGSMFKRDHRRAVASGPERGNMVRYWDLAGTEKSAGNDPDYTVGALVMEHDGIWYVLEVLRGRMEADGIERLMRQTAVSDRERFGNIDTVVEQEPGSSGKNYVKHLTRNVLRGFAVYGDKPTGSKQERARPLAAAWASDNVRLVSAPWNEAFVEELVSFPHGRHDDQVDAVSGAFGWLMTRYPIGKTQTRETGIKTQPLSPMVPDAW